MTKQNNSTPELDKEWVRKLRSKPLVSRPVWLMRRLAYVLLWIVLLLLVLAYADGIWMVLGLSVLALGAVILPEILTDLRYSKYRKEWEVANSTDAPVCDGKQGRRMGGS